MDCHGDMFGPTPTVDVESLKNNGRNGSCLTWLAT